jgi:hypothetical protein
MVVVRIYYYTPLQRVLWRRERRTFNKIAKKADDEFQPFLLAHMNYALLRAPLDDPTMAEFAAAVYPVNALAKSTPGFVWSFDNDCPATRNAVPELRNNPLLMPQLSLWTNIESLRHFAFKSGHSVYLKRKREWFAAATSSQEPYAVCWWRPAGMEPPTLVEAFERCKLLGKRGASRDAFDFATAKEYPMPSEYS